MRICKICNKELPLTSFDNHKPGLWRWNCKKCHNKRHYGKKRARKLQGSYGISVAEYDTMFASQDGLCACCRKEVPRRNLCIDHDHKTGKIRGLLCGQCNTGIGLLGDSFSGVLNALGYLVRNYKPV